MKIEEHKSYQYAVGVTTGNIVAAKYIKISCQRFLNELHDPNSKYFIDLEQLKLIDGLTKLINMPTGLRVGMSANDALVGFQWFFIVNALCWYHKDKPNKRRFEKSVMLIGRKNGKSFLVALVMLILMMIEPKHSQFYSVAPDRELSGIIKEEIEKMLDASPAINNRFKSVLKEIRFELKKTTFEPLAFSHNRMDGRLATAFIADEVGALPTSYPIESMQSSQMNLVNKTGILISTAYDTTNNPMIDEIDYAEKVLDGVIEDDTLFALLYKPDDMKDWLSDTALLQANPLAIEIPENYEELEKMRKRAIEFTSAQTNFKTKHLNIFVDGAITEMYVAADDLRKCKTKANSYNWKGKEVYIGVDLSQTTDNTAISMVTFDKLLDRYVTKVWAFLPEDNVETKSKTERVDYHTMKRFGYCFFSGDKVINYREVEDFVLGLEEKYGVNIKSIAYDRYNAISSVNRWHDSGYEVVEVKQHSSVLHPATKLLKECILNERFAYESNKLFEINVANALEVKDTNLNGYVSKKKSKGKIDMLAATIFAMVLWNRELEEGESVYEQGMKTV